MEMVEQDFGTARVDVCADGCQGIWFDWGELARLDENHEGLGEALQQALLQPPRTVERKRQLVCPRCTTPMHEHRHRLSKQVYVDECYSCGGFFLDAGELVTLRSNHLSDAEKQLLVKQLRSDRSGSLESGSRTQAAIDRLLTILNIG
jgi:Zn-finger nucleic acid-binding protein